MRLGEFYSSDVDLAAFFRCRGIRYLRLERNPTNPAITDFVFPESTELFDHLREWADEEASCCVDARKFGTIRRHFFKAAQAYSRRASTS